MLERVQTERLVGTRPVPQDGDALAPVVADLRVADWLWPGDLGGARTLEQTRKWIANDIAHWERHGFGPWMVRDRATGEVVGRVGLLHTPVEGEDAVEVGWIVAPARWRQGLASEMAGAAVRAGFEEVGLDLLVAMTLPHNAASIGVMRRLGFGYSRDIVRAGLSHVLYVLAARA